MSTTTIDRIRGINSGVAIKAPCRVATTANITLSGEQTIDGVAVVAGDRVLVKNQSTASENGIYDVATSSWTRSLDFDGTNDVVTGTAVFITAGSTYANTSWQISTTGTITIDSTSIAFTQSYSLGQATAFMQTVLDDTTAAAARATLGAAALGANSDITSLSAVASINGGQLAGFRNGIINGDFRIWRRATTYALTTSAAYGSADRFFALMSSSAAGIFNRDTSVPTPDTSTPSFQYSAKVGRDSGSSLANAISVGQVIETTDAIRYAGKKATLSFWAKAGANYSSSSSALSVSLRTGTGTDEGASSGFSGSWTGYVNTTMSASSVTLTTSWQRFSVTTSSVLPATIKEIMVLLQYTPSGTAGADDNFYITGIQLETGEVATSYEFRAIAVEDVLCRRFLPYFESDSTTSDVADGWSPTTSTGYGRFVFRVEPRTAPTGIVVSSASHFNYTGYSGATAAATALVFVRSSKRMATLQATVSGTPFTAAQGGYLFANSTSGKITFTGCEL